MFSAGDGVAAVRSSPNTDRRWEVTVASGETMRDDESTQTAERPAHIEATYAALISRRSELRVGVDAAYLALTNRDSGEVSMGGELRAHFEPRYYFDASRQFGFFSGVLSVGAAITDDQELHQTILGAIKLGGALPLWERVDLVLAGFMGVQAIDQNKIVDGTSAGIFAPVVGVEGGIRF